MNHIQIDGSEDHVVFNFFVAKNTIDEFIMNTEAPYSINLMYDMLTVASFLLMSDMLAYGGFIPLMSDMITEIEYIVIIRSNIWK